MQKTVVVYTDDLDGTTDDSVQEVRFGLDGHEFVVDLNGKNAAALREILAPYIEHGSKTGGRRAKGTTTPKPSGPSSGSKANRAAIREWAAEQGVRLAERGRLPATAIQAYEAKDPSLLQPSFSG